MNNNHQLPIGIFDSGVGGLTVLKSLIKKLPNEKFIYLGDTARLPYGTKSQNIVIEDSLNACKELIEREIKLLVVACNTASALALKTLQQSFNHIPIVGVLEPGAEAVTEVTQNNHILVVATEATINSSCYQRAIRKINPNAHITAKSCGLFVSLAEEGLVKGEIPEAIVRWYLQPMIYNNHAKPDALLLGCTHFPILSPAIEKVFGHELVIVDSAKSTADAVSNILKEMGALTPDRQETEVQFLVTDLPERFQRISTYFLGQLANKGNIEVVRY